MSETRNPSRQLQFIDHNANPPNKTTIAHRLSSPPPASSFSPQGKPLYDSLTDEEKKTLRETLSLFICCRHLLSVHQVRYLSFLTHLQCLNLHMNRLTTVEPGVLSHLRHLEELDLSANEMERLSRRSFEGLTALKKLNLSSNCLTDLDPIEEVEQGGGGEEEEEMEKRRITKKTFRASSPSKVGKKLPSNHPQNAYDGIFTPLVSLQVLNLAFNKIHQLHGLRSIPVAREGSIPTSTTTITTTTGPKDHKEEEEGKENDLRWHRSYLRTIDVSGNAIPSLDTVKEGLELQRFNLEEIRLKVATTTMTMTTGKGAKGEEENGNPTPSNEWMTHWIKENPLVLSAEEKDSEGNPSPLPSYVEALLRYFPTLRWVDGETYGYDPVEEGKLKKMEGESTLEQRRIVKEAEEQYWEDMRQYHSLQNDVQHLRKELDEMKAIGNDPIKGQCRAEGAEEEEESATAGKTPVMERVPPPLFAIKDGPSRYTSDDDLDIPAFTPTVRPRLAPLSATLGGKKAHLTPSEKLTTLRRHSWATTSPLSTGGKCPYCKGSTTPSAGTSPPSAKEDSPSTEENETTVAPSTWSPKQISRGTNTSKEDDGNRSTHEEDTPPPAVLLEPLQQQIQDQEERLQQLQEQIIQRSVVEPQQQWQAEKQALRAEHQAYKERAKREQQVLHSQVSALKDELLRQRQEKVLLHEKYKHELREALERQKEEFQSEKETVERETTAKWEKEMSLQQKKFDTTLQNETKSFQVFCKEQEHYFKTLLAECKETVQRETQQRERELYTNEKNRLFIQLDAVYTVTLQEAEKRRQLEQEQEKQFLHLLHQQHYGELLYRQSHQLERADQEKEMLLHHLQNQNQTWERYCKGLQDQYNEALRHAEEEVSRLLIALEKPTAAPAVAATAEVDTEKQKSVLDVGCDPIDTAAPNETALSIIVDSNPNTHTHTNTTTASPVDWYWREVARRIQGELDGLQEAAQVHQSSQSALTKENNRLLECITALEESYRTLQETSTTEKENLLRTLQVLKDDLRHKEEALDQLEEEAREKIEEKRHRIILLEEELELVKEDKEKSVAQCVQHAEEAAAYRSKWESLREQYQGVLQMAGLDIKEEGVVLGGKSPLLQRLAEKDALLSALQSEKEELIQGLMTARNQLVHAAMLEEQLHQQVGERTERIRQLSEEKKGVEERYHELLSSSKERQKLTFQALTGLMMD